MTRIVVNGVELLATNLKMGEETSKPTGNELRKLEFDIEVRGCSEKEKLEDLFSEKILSIKIVDENIDIKAKIEDRTYSYQGKEQDENAIYQYTVSAIELDKDLPEDWSVLGTLIDQVVMNWIRTRAISELLVEKNIITMNEYENKIDEVYNRDYENLRNYILYGIQEKENK